MVQGSEMVVGGTTVAAVVKGGTTVQAERTVGEVEVTGVVKDATATGTPGGGDGDSGEAFEGKAGTVGVRGGWWWWVGVWVGMGMWWMV